MAKRLIFFLLLITTFQVSYGQSYYDYLDVKVNTTLGFNLNTAAKLESDQTISNAITLSVKCASRSCTVYAELSSWSYPTSAYPTFSPLYLDLSSKSSSSASSVASAANIVNSNVMLFQQSRMSWFSSPYTFNYNLRMKAIGYNNGFAPGHYSYTILFTMTEP